MVVGGWDGGWDGGGGGGSDQLVASNTAQIHHKLYCHEQMRIIPAVFCAILVALGGADASIWHSLVGGVQSMYYTKDRKGDSVCLNVMCVFFCLCFRVLRGVYMARCHVLYTSRAPCASCVTYNQQ